MKVAGIVLCLCLSLGLWGQKIRYTRQNQPIRTDAIQLVANIQGFHHVLCFTEDLPATLLIFDQQLQFVKKQLIDFIPSANCDIRIIPLGSFYWIYAHLPGTARHQLWKIDSHGAARSCSGLFQSVTDSVFRKTAATLQIIDQNGQTFVLGQTYYDSLKKISVTVCQLDSSGSALKTKRAYFSFNNRYETLRQITMAGNYLFILKSIRNKEESSQSLELEKLNMADGQSISIAYKNDLLLYGNPVFTRSDRDSSIIIYSLLTEPFGSKQRTRAVFISRLDQDLKELAPVSILRTQFRNRTVSNFLLLENTSFKWLNVYNSMLNSSMRNLRLDPASRMLVDNAPGYYDVTKPEGVRFTLLNSRLHPLNDSLIANVKNRPDILPRPFGSFTLNNNSYLMLIQNLTANSRGLVLVSHKLNGFTMDPIPVYEKNDYLVEQVQAVSNKSILIPYKYRNEIGLVQISVDVN